MANALAAAETAAFKAKSAASLYTGSGKDSGDKNKKKMSVGKKAAAITIAFLLIVALVGALIMTPVFLIGTIKENLIKTLGFNDTVAILEEQAEYVTGEKLAKGVMPSGYSKELARAGIEVGQVTAAGKFVRTDTYIANIDELDMVAAEGEYYVHGGEGELVIKFGDEIITADNFVAAVESSPTMYAAYSEALDISARYYYSDAVNDVYNNMGLTRGAFNGWSATGDTETDKESFLQTLSRSLDKESNRNMSGAYKVWHADCTGWTTITVGEGENAHEVTICIEKTWFGDPVTWECMGGGSSWNCSHTITHMTGNSEGDEWPVGDPVTTPTSITGEPEEVAQQIVDYVSQNSRIEYEDDCTPIYETFDAGHGHTGVYSNSNQCSIKFTAEENAAQILNTVISADEPYRAASAFMAVVESIERAQIDGDGPVNEVMNMLSTPTEVSYVDMNTGATVTEKKSVLETLNFKAAVADGEFSKTEANNLARDRLLEATGTARKESIEHMVMSTDGKKKSGDGADMKNNEHSTVSATNAPASLSGGAKPDDAMRVAMAEKNSELFQTSLGANRILEGGSLVSNTINQQVIGAMPSDAAQVALYQQEVNEVLARKAEAERATKSPFDISSPYTFMGSLVRKMAKISINNYTTNDQTLLGAIRNFAGLVGESMTSIGGKASADNQENYFTAAMGDNCDTASTVGATCNLYGSTHNTVYTGHMNWGESQWASAVSEAEMDEFVNQAMKRDMIVGTRSYEVCTASKSDDAGGTSSGGVLGAIKGFFGKIVAAVKKVITVITGASALQSGCDGTTTVVDGEETKEGEVSMDIATGKEYVLHGGEDNDTAKKSGYALYATVSALIDEMEEGETAEIHNTIMYLPDNR